MRIKMTRRRRRRTTTRRRMGMRRRMTMMMRTMTMSRIMGRRTKTRRKRTRSWRRRRIYLVVLGRIDNLFCNPFNDFVVCYSLSVPITHYLSSMKYPNYDQSMTSSTPVLRVSRHGIR
jgi:hypothetical protein